MSRVPITVMLDPNTFQTFERAAEAKGERVADLIADLARAAAQGRVMQIRTKRRVTSQVLALASELRQKHHSWEEIGRALGFPTSTLYAHRARIEGTQQR